MAWSYSNLGFVATEQGRLDEARSFYGRSLALGREIGDSFGIALSLHALADVALRQDDHEGARCCHAEALEIRRDLGDRRGIAESMESFASLLAAEADPVRAVQLLAAADVLRERIHAPVAAARREELDRQIDALRDALGDTAFREEWSRARVADPDPLLDEVLTQSGREPRSPSSSSSGRTG
jgi:hypothetical protein